MVFLNAHFFRDINPNNIIISKSEETNKISVKLIDFNASQKFKAGQLMMTKTGFLPYRSPELIPGGSLMYSESVDLWSLGAVLIFMVSGLH